MTLIDFSNTNTIWASILVETLSCLGLETVVISPGSRSAPLTIAFARHSSIEAIPILDERSAAFFALGVARRTGNAVALVCTSGTAGANFYAAMIEARESRVPLLVLTSDRPPELRECNAGQTVDQQKLFGDFPNWYSEIAVPGLDLKLLQYLRQTLIQAWERTLYPVPGVVHLNLPFRDPLAPVAKADAAEFGRGFPEDFFDWIPRDLLQTLAVSDRHSPVNFLPPGRTILVAGVAQPADPQAYCEAIAHISKTLQIPVLAEGLSPLRNYADLNPSLISTYDWIVRDVELAKKLAPDFVVRVGEMPTSKTLRHWLEQVQPLQWVVDEGDRNLDPLHGKTLHLRRSLPSFAANLPAQPSADLAYLEAWCGAEERVRRSLDESLSQASEEKFEGKAVWLLSQHLPTGTPLIIANSTAVRYLEWFWKPGNRAIRPFCNRGANGIDGTLSTALGVAHRQQSSVLLTGDLALLHDTNGFLIRNYFVGHLTIVLINNNGGGIFEHLPIAQFNPPFEEFFATPQHINFALLCQTYNAKHELIRSWDQLVQRLNPLPAEGIRVLEVECDRQFSTQFSARWQP
ncbi:MAG: 2-succinyl-5-enolpyruvyl-6-hydroxy-3-cyclohexene-1-carboxylic-acid synthase [Timaviella obliquedivisa GSE-PSE-MK23-08B]|nr:2-succinyl-5-enolpyruvyl-6-hydroxy-3-cyclohexene-1-carboxylic-acid synthase [Timaviella obliquedivisa GSE-PSE-MK23-08B]